MAYDAAIVLADALETAAGKIPLSSAVASNLTASTDLVRNVLAPQLTTLTRAAEIGVALATAIGAIGDDAGAGDIAIPLYAAATSAAGAVALTASPGLTRHGSLARALAACVEAAFLGQAFLAEAQTQYADRQSAAEARQRIADAMEDASDRIADAAGIEIFGVLADVAQNCNAQLVTLATDLKPVVKVSAKLSLPAALVAWMLYSDPTEAEDLVTRNRCGTPLFMPATIEALSPSSSS
ncbi:hypothetical protein [Faunimonas pinastri]|nr:hypothetical protein [Faunimonas pinastri]